MNRNLNTMNRIDKCFHEKKKNILSVYFTAGYPELKDTTEIIRALDTHGADMMEIGMPFSDPVADGPVIQQSSKKALDNGMSLKVLFEQLADLRDISELPVILMGYLNPVYRMGMERFLDKCAEVGVDGLILPDLPPDEYREKYKEMFEERGLHNILLVSPQTPEDRIYELDELSGGFLYLVSSYATTGVKKAFGEEQRSYFERLGRMGLKNPGLIGFGVSGKETFDTACAYAAGAITGTAFIQALTVKRTVDESVKAFMESFGRKGN